MSSSSKSIVRIVEFTSFEANEDGIVECDALTALANDHDGHDARDVRARGAENGGGPTPVSALTPQQREPA